MPTVDLSQGSGGHRSGVSGVVFRRRESALSSASAAVNERSSYEARSVFELDALSAVGAIVNTQDGVHRFIRDQRLRELWLDTLERELLKRYLERILASHPTVHEAIEHLDTTKGFSDQRTRHDARHELIEPVASTDPFIELVHYAVFEMLAADPRAALVARSGLASSRIGDLLADSKQRALSMLIEWITRPAPSSFPARSEFESVLLDHKDRPSVKQSVRHFRQIVRRELQFLREYVVKFVSNIADKPFPGSGASASSAILQTHIPETFLRNDFCLPTRGKQAFLSDIEKLHEPSNSVEGALVDVIDPSLNCRVINDKSRRTQHLPIVISGRDNEPEVFSAYGHGGQSSSSRASKHPSLHGKSPGFQWLPSDVMVHSAGVASIESEINSIHPAAYPAIYSGMEHLVAGFVPLFEQVLASISTVKPPPPSLQGANSLIDRRIRPLPTHFPGCPIDVIEKAVMTKSNSNGTTPFKTEVGSGNTDTSGSMPTAAELQDHWNTYFLEHRLPPRPHFVQSPPPTTMDESPAFPLQKRRIQVIPKVSTIHLTSARPKFVGQHSRAWQVDGDSNERLVAIGFHVLELENVSTPEISFRAFAHKPLDISEPVPSATSSHTKDELLEYGEKIAGYHDGSYGRTFLQPWGSMALLPDRSFAVPAFLAHRLEPFELLDPSLNGRLTLVTLFLVDPTHAIASTTSLRLGQHDRRWVEANVDLLRDPLTPTAAHLSSALLGRSRGRHERCETRDFPDEIAQLMVDFAASDASSAAANCRRELLAKERARRHEIRFLHPTRTLEQLRIALPDAKSSV